MPNTPKRPRWYLRLDSYHRFVVKRMMDVTDADKSAMLERMVVQWAAGNLDQLEKAKAGMDDWIAARDTWQEEEEDDD